jgi:catechol 2,3-dioxygenase-like lactoylglutathione lyase family enzyme
MDFARTGILLRGNQMATYGYDHLHFRSEDPHAARKFWEDMFGAKLVQERELGGAPSFNMDLNGMTFIVSGRAKNEDPVRTNSDPRYGLDHFGLRVDNMDKAAEELRSKGAEFICEPWEIRAGVKIAFIKGPDNVSIELAQRD